MPPQDMDEKIIIIPKKKHEFTKIYCLNCYCLESSNKCKMLKTLLIYILGFNKQNIDYIVN